MLPAAESVFDAINAAYEQGRISYLEVLDAQRTLMSAGGQYLRAMAEQHKAAADVERLIGAPLTTIVAAPSTSGKE